MCKRFQLPCLPFLCQLSEVELAADAKHVVGIVQEVPHFMDIISKLQPQDIPPLLDEALHVLHRSPGPDDRDSPADVYTDSCMVFSLLLQWLISYMSRRLLQLMTPEAFIVNSRHIPIPYREMYLQFQEHFSVKELIVRQREKLHLNKWLVISGL